MSLVLFVKFVFLRKMAGMFRLFSLLFELHVAISW